MKMVNLYAFSQQSKIIQLNSTQRFPIKFGDSQKHTGQERILQQERLTTNTEPMITIGIWDGCSKISRDFDVHKVLTERGLHWKEGLGNEWFAIPATNEKEAFDYLDQIVTDLEGKKIRKAVKLRKTQQKNLDKAMEMLAKGKTKFIAYLCPRFGKTIWALKLFNQITEKYGNRVMLLPAYWLSSHTSFDGEIKKFADFSDIEIIDPNDPDAEENAYLFLNLGKRIVVIISLHGDIDKSWKDKQAWVRELPHSEKFIFADEGDFGTHTEKQVKKLNYLIGK
jgi:hypothetical protein